MQKRKTSNWNKDKIEDNGFIHNLPNKVKNDEQFLCKTSYDQIGIRREIPLTATFISHQEIPGPFELCRFPRHRGAVRGLEQHAAPLWSAADTATLSFTLCVHVLLQSFIHLLTFSHPGAPLCCTRTALSEWGPVGQRSHVCLARREEGHLGEVQSLFLPLALACHANEQQHMWLCD